MAQDFGILITAPGTDVIGAPKNKVLMNTTNPFIKIDTQTATGFQTILLLITTDPPEPSAGNYTRTIVYQFAHGYKYVPSVEMLFNVTSAPPGAAYTQTYFQDSGIIGQHTALDSASLYTSANATNVYIICEKFKSATGSPQSNLLTGTTIQITSHVFADGIGI